MNTFLIDQQNQIEADTVARLMAVVDALNSVESRFGPELMHEWAQRCFGWNADRICSIRKAANTF